MKFLAATFYAIAIGAHTAGALDAVMTGGCVFVGTVFALFAVECVVKQAIVQSHHKEPL